MLVERTEVIVELCPTLASKGELIGFIPRIGHFI